MFLSITSTHLLPCSRYCGSIEPMKMPGGSGSTVNALFVSADRRIPKIRIQTRQLANLIDKRIMVSVDSWEPTSRYPSGHYVRMIGDIGDRATESDVSCLFVPLTFIKENTPLSISGALLREQFLFLDLCFMTFPGSRRFCSLRMTLIVGHFPKQC